MAPKTDVVDLTQTSDDDEGPSASSQNRSSSQFRPHLGRKSKAGVSKPKYRPHVSGSQRSRNNLLGSSRRSSSVNGPQSSSEPRPTSNGATEEPTQVSTPRLQDKVARADRGVNGTPPGSSKVAKESRKAQPETINLNSDDDEPSATPQFKMPQSLDRGSTHQSPHAKRDLDSPSDADEQSRRKRPRGPESPLGRPSQSKRQKLSSESINRQSSRERSRKTESASQGPKPAKSRVSATIDLTSSPNDESRKRPSHLMNGGDVETKSRSPSVRFSGLASPSVNGPSSPRKLSTLAQNGAEDSMLQRLGTRNTTRRGLQAPSQSHNSPTSQSKTRPPPAEEDLINGETGGGGSKGVFKSPVPGPHAREVRSPMSRTAAVQGSAKSATSGSRQITAQQKSGLRSTSPNSPGRSSLVRDETVSQSQRDSLVHERKQPGTTLQLPRQPVKTMSPRRTSSDDDQGYVSLSSSNQGLSFDTVAKHATLSTQTSQNDSDSLLEASNADKTPKQTLVGGKGDASLGAASDINVEIAGPSQLPTMDGQQETSSGTLRVAKDVPIMTSPTGGTLTRPGALDEPMPVQKQVELAVEYEDEDVDRDARADQQVDTRTNQRAENPTSDEADLQLRSEAMQGVEKDMSLTQLQDDEASQAYTPITSKSHSLYSGMPLARRVETVLGKYVEELRGDNEYWTSVELTRARLAKDAPQQSSQTTPGQESDKSTSFSHMKPLKLLSYQKNSRDVEPDQIWGIEKMQSSGKPLTNTTLSTSYRSFAGDTRDVPDYAHYVSIQNNILGPNVLNLHYWPYFGDDFEIARAESLHEQYNIDILPRERKLQLLLQAQKYEEYVESALSDLECSWSDVLRFLLETNPNVGKDLDAIKAVHHRPQFCGEDFSRANDQWTTVLAGLPPSTPQNLAHAAVLCENFHKLAKFSLWHVARRSDLANLRTKSKDPTSAQPADNDYTCRICLRFDCPYHGEFKERPDDGDSDGGSASSIIDSVVATDIIHPQQANYRSRIGFPPALPDASGVEVDAKLRVKKGLNYWHNGSFNHSAEERGPFYPCHHPGSSCEDANCSCFRNHIPCEKICSCSSSCTRKFKGCSCPRGKGQRLVCFNDDRCVCFQLGRECDPDLCGGCGVLDVVDPTNKDTDEILLGRCCNADLQRARPKHTILGDSGVHGLGLYACEDIHKHECVGEYKGEIITKQEADRRGAVYEFQKLSYLFSLNATQELDSTVFGNKVRFINHAKDKANLYPRIIMVNAVHRIGMYAKCKIRAGQELFFDYGPKFPDEQLGGKKEKKSAPHVRNVNLVREFLDVEQSADAHGNIRAKGVSRAANTEARGQKRRGGARVGAGRKPFATKTQRPESPVHDDADPKGVPAPEPDLEPERDAGERLAAFNISDDRFPDAMDVDEAYGGAEDDEAFEPEPSDSNESERSDDSESSEFEEDEEEEEQRPRRSTLRTGAGAGSWRYARR